MSASTEASVKPLVENMNDIYWGLIKDFMDELRANSNIVIKNITTPQPMTKKEREYVKTVNPSDIFDFHSEMNGLNVEWKGKKVKNADIKGSIKILSAQQVLQDWKGIVYFDFTPDDDRIKNFHPIDFFIDEACVGVFLNESEKKDSSLYLFSFEGEPVNLNMNINAYLEMAIASKGFLYWQYAVIEILEGKENPVSNRFKEWMPKLFVNFSWEQYMLLYKKIRIL